MANRLITGLLVIALAATSFLGVRAFVKNPCTTTLSWSLGDIDPRFNISRDTVLAYSKEAANTWNKAYSPNPLLEHREKNGDITITFVYDERQRTTIQNERLKRTIEDEKKELTEIKETIESLRAEYQRLEESISSKTAAYNSRLSKHNKEIAYWNDRGGAPNDVYQRIQREAASLETERVSINAAISRYNRLADQIRNYGKEHNEIVGTINEKIGGLNETALRDFEEGTYDPGTETITIYEYGSIIALKRVLLHEFGHAIGLGHVDDEEAIMYSINQGKNVDLTDSDKAELAKRCRQKTLDDVVETARSIRDDIFHLAGLSGPDRAVQGE